MSILACLSVRFAIEIRPSNAFQEKIVHELVEAHMRFCVKADPRLRMATVAPSEPLLAEADFEHLLLVLRDPSHSVAPKVFDETEENDMQDLDRSVLIGIKICCGLLSDKIPRLAH